MAIRCKHSFNAGDAITILPGLQHLYKTTGKKTTIYQRLDLPAYYFDDAEHPVKTEGKQVCMNQKVFEMMKPLLEAQEYIESFEIWKGESDIHFNFDETRQTSQSPLPGGMIHQWATLMFPQLECDLSIPWLSAPIDEKYSDKIIINRTSRYRIPYIDYYFLKEHQDKILFVGLDFEHKEFCEQWELDIPFLRVNDFLELAVAINSCRFFVGNQSLCWHLADAMKIKRLLETCVYYPNSFPTGKNGYAFVKQNHLEYRFNELLKETE